MVCGLSSSESSRFAGGWLEEKYHLSSWIFSCMQLKKYYPTVDLITDELGYQILIEELQLPYDNVHVRLDELNNYPAGLWALGKIYSYSIQNTPFIHVDNDVYIWEAFSKDLCSAQLLAQNIEINYPFYQSLYESLQKNDFYIPKVVLQNKAEEKSIAAFNAGIIGGNDTAFFKIFSKEAFRFVDNNLHKVRDIDIGRFNTIFEQHLFYCLSKVSNISVRCYTNNTCEEELAKELKSLERLRGAPKNAKFIHLYGEDCKKSMVFCKEVMNKVIESYPEFYFKLLKYATKKTSIRYRFSNEYTLAQPKVKS